MYAIQVMHENDGPRLIGSVLRTRPLAEKLAIVRRFWTRFWPHMESGAIRPVIDRSFPLTGQFTRYLLEHPGLFAALPDQFELVLLPQNDTELQLYNLRLLEKFGSEGRPVVLARLHRTGVDMTHQPPPQIYVPLVA